MGKVWNGKMNIHHEPTEIGIGGGNNNRSALPARHLERPVDDVHVHHVTSRFRDRLNDRLNYETELGRRHTGSSEG